MYTRSHSPMDHEQNFILQQAVLSFIVETLLHQGTKNILPDFILSMSFLIMVAHMLQDFTYRHATKESIVNCSFS
jgi:hypothetical protein